MTAPHVLPVLPAFIPRELCDTVGIDPGHPDAPALCMEVVNDDLRDDGVSAQGVTPEQLAELQQVVSDARADDLDLKIVVINHNPHIDTPLRDIATEVSLVYPDSTVLALSPSFAGTYSPVYDRVTLEAGEDVAKTGDPVVSAQNFVTEVNTPDFPWTAFTIVLVLLVVVAAVATRLLQVWGKRAAASPSPADEPA